MWKRSIRAREGVRLLGQTIKFLSPSLQFADFCLEAGLCSRLSVRKDVRGISCWLPRTIGFIYLMVSLAFFTSSSPRIPTPVGVWQGAREDSWTPTEFSLALLEPCLTPPPPSSYSKKKRSHVRSLSQPPPPSILQGNGCHWVSAPLIWRKSGVLRSFVVSLASL